MRGGTRLRVAIDVTPALRQSGGVGRYTRELVAALALRRSGQYVAFVADRADARDVVAALGGWPGPVRVSGLPSRLHAILWQRLGLPLTVERWVGAVDVFHATDFVTPPLAAAAGVVTVHDLSFLTVPERAEPALCRYLSRAVPRSVRRAAHVLADSESTRRDIVELLGVPGQRVSVAYPGVSSVFRRVTDEGERRRVAAAHHLDRPFVLGVGTLEPRKDWPTLVKAFEATPLAGTHALVIAGGRGWRTGGLDQAIRRSPADVRLLGRVPDADLPALYSLAQIFAYPSVYEGFGLPPLEALACGVPTLVSTASSLPEVVGGAALLVPPGDVAAVAEALIRLSRDEALRAELIAAGPARAAAFSWDGCAVSAENAYAAARTAGGATRL